MPVPSYTKLQKLLLEMHKINTRLAWTDSILEYFMKIWKKDFYGKLRDSEKENQLEIQNLISRILFEYNVVNLYSLIEIKPTIDEELKKLGMEKLADSLHESWQIIEKQKNRIKKYRNLFVAHSKINIETEDYPMLEKFDKSFLDAIKDISLAAKCGLIYISPIIYSLEDEWEMAMLQYRLEGGRPDFQINWSEQYSEIQEQFEKISEKISFNLLKSGYMPITDDNI